MADVMLKIDCQKPGRYSMTFLASISDPRDTISDRPVSSGP